MSTGERVPLADAHRALAYLATKWSLDSEAVQVVGSVRRKRPDVGDLELVAPAWSGAGRDELFERIARTMKGQHAAYAPEPVSLFATGPIHESDVRVETIACEGEPIGEVDQGLKPGFLHARLKLYRRDRSRPPIPCEVYRYTPTNRGWITVMRTGPGDFGRYFLRWWKRAHEIDEGFQASIEGHLVDAAQRVIPVATEEECFAKCGMKYIAPEDRDAQVAAWGNYFRNGVGAIR